MAQYVINYLFCQKEFTDTEAQQVTYTHDNRNAIFKLSCKLKGDNDKIVEEKCVEKHDAMIQSLSLLQKLLFGRTMT